MLLVLSRCDSTQVEHLLVLLSRHSRECFECQCNSDIYRQRDLKRDNFALVGCDLNLISLSEEVPLTWFLCLKKIGPSIRRRWRRTRTRSWPTWPAATSTLAQSLLPSLTLERRSFDGLKRGALSFFNQHANISTIIMLCTLYRIPCSVYLYTKQHSVNNPGFPFIA